MKWGCYSWSGLRFSNIMCPKMRSADYLSLLNDQVFPLINIFIPIGRGIFQDDNTRIHRAQIMKVTMEASDICDWTPQGPPLKPTENLWIMLEKTWNLVCFLQKDIWWPSLYSHLQVRILWYPSMKIWFNDSTPRTSFILKLPTVDNF